MADLDQPFVPGQDVYECFKRVHGFFTTDVFGKDPLGMSPSQAKSMFMQRKSAFYNANAGALVSILQEMDDTTGLKAVRVPSRMTADEPLYGVAQGNDMLGVSTSSKHPELAEAFIDFYFGEDWYPRFIQAVSAISTMDNMPSTLNEVYESAKRDYIKDVVYAPSSEKLLSIESYVKFNCKKEGAKMFMNGYDFDKECANLNKQWTEARKALGYTN